MPDSESRKAKVAALSNILAEKGDNYKLLVLAYWSVCDGIDIPKEIINNIVQNGTDPETITRLHRLWKQDLKIEEALRAKQIMLHEEESEAQ